MKTAIVSPTNSVTRNKRELHLNFLLGAAHYGGPWEWRKRGGAEQHPRGGDVLPNIRDLLNSACGDCVNSIRTESGGCAYTGPYCRLP